MRYILILLPLFAFFSCENPPTEKEVQTANIGFYPLEIKELDDKQYPDNPDIGFRDENYDFNYFVAGKLVEEKSGYSFKFVSKKGDSIIVDKLNIEDFIPAIPDNLKEDKYLKHICAINQEWNRNQVHLLAGEFKSSDQKVARVDIARNCLNSYLWEVILYTNKEGKMLPMAHGWFNFPQNLYKTLFKKVNNESFDAYHAELEDWIDPKSKEINKSLLRQNAKEIAINYTDQSDAMYPLEGARKKKFKEIIYPESFQTMRDLQNDSTLFATFTPPGFYNRADPRVTELGRLFKLENIQLLAISDSLNEIEMTFKDRKNDRETHLVIGGIDMNIFPKLSVEKANKGWKNSMGFGNHPFYESHEEHIHWKCQKSPYYAYFSDETGKWLDSHKIGVDGPIFHWDTDTEGQLHIWLLSFERHALVGHYTIKLKGLTMNNKTN